MNDPTKGCGDVEAPLTFYRIVDGSAPVTLSGNYLPPAQRIQFRVQLSRKMMRLWGMSCPSGSRRRQPLPGLFHVERLGLQPNLEAVIAEASHRGSLRLD